MSNDDATNQGRTPPPPPAFSGAAPGAGWVLAQRYQLSQPIARGGMAQVWEARDQILDRAVAIKILHPHLATDEDFLERFRREAVAAARLTHPNVVATFDAGTDTQGDVTTPYIVMELVRGPTLRKVLKSQELSIADCASFAMQVADALNHAHSVGLIHRDIKPANILLCEQYGDRFERAMVADFGIARLSGGAGGPDLTQVGGLVGTAKYLAPEQVEGHPIDPRTDIYALGVVLYEMLCGQPPFQGDSDVSTALLHVQATPALPRTLRIGIPKSLELIVMKAMARDPNTRYQTAGDLRDALAALDFGDDADVMVDPHPTPRTGTKPIQAKRTRRSFLPVFFLLLLTAALAAVCLFLVGQLGYGPLAEKHRHTAVNSTPIRLTSAQAFDPEGDGHENDAQAGAAIDNNTTTAWLSDRYHSAHFGNLKSGLGLIVIPSSAADVQSVHVVTGAQNWSAAIYVANSPETQLNDWRQPVANQSNITGPVTFTFPKVHAGAILLWITDPGSTNQISIDEVTVR